MVTNYFRALIFLILLLASFPAAAQEIPVEVTTTQNALVMLMVDDSGSMRAIIEHSEFDENSALANDTSLTLPSIFFRLDSGASAPALTQQMTPVLWELNWGLWGRTGTNPYASAAMNSMSTHPLLANITCNNSSNSLVNCPATGASTPQRGINAIRHYTNTSTVGSSIFTLANLAQTSGVYNTDSLGNEYLYASYRRNDYASSTYNFSGTWANFDASGNNQFYSTRVYATLGGRVLFNGKEVVLASGWYRAEYLRWIFYGATAAQLASLPGQNRMDAVKSTLTTLITNNPQVDFGLATLNGSASTYGVSGSHDLGDIMWNGLWAGTGAAPRIRSFIGATQASLLSQVNSLVASGGTPLSASYIEILRYFHGESENDPYRSSMTYTNPFQSECDSGFVIMLTDGLPSSDTPNRMFNVWVSDYDGDHDEGAANNNNCASDVCSSFLDDAAWHARHNDYNSGITGTQSILSYALGFALNYDLLNEFAINGGSGRSIQVNNATEVSDQLQNIVNSLVTTAVGAAGTAVAEVFGEDSRVYRPSFEAAHWSGSVDTFVASGSNLIHLFDMGDLLAERNLTSSPRTIITADDPDGDGSTNTQITFNLANASTLRARLFKNYISGASSPTLLAAPLASYDTTAAQTLINFIHGTDATGLRSRPRDDGLTARLGDINHSRPKYVGIQNGRYNSMNGYVDYVRSRSSQPKLLLVGSNDGMLHGFNAENGEELWAYIPSSLLPYLELLARTTYNTDYHRYFVNGQITVEDVYLGGSWKTIAMFGLAGGGSQYIVLDITNRSSPQLLFEVSNATSWGESWSEPAVVITGGSSSPADPSDYTWRMVVGTGEDKTTAGANIAVMSLGSTVPAPTIISISASSPAGTRTTSAAAVQADQDFAVDRLYVGTEDGDMYRVHVNGSPGSWSVQKLFDGVSTQPIVARPAVVLVDNPQYVAAGTGVASHKYAVGVYWGTGRYNVSADVTTVFSVAQSIYGIFDPLEISADTYADVRTNVTKASLRNQTVGNYSVVAGTDGVYRIASTYPGFYIDLSTSIVQSGNYINPVGGVVHAPAAVQGSLIFSTFLPNASVCTAGGYGFVQLVNFRTGGGAVIDSQDPENPFYNGGIPDMNGNGAKNSTDLTLAINESVILPVLDTAIASYDPSDLVRPYRHDGVIDASDVRLHSTNGGINPAVSSLGANGIPGPPSVLFKDKQLVIQSAYITNDTGGGSSGGEDDVDEDTVICHYPPGNPENRHTISVGEAAISAHIAHGDTLGPCPEDEVETTVVICYSETGDPADATTMTIPESRRAEYLALGASMGACTGDEDDGTGDGTSDAPPPDTLPINMPIRPPTHIASHTVTGD